MFNIIISPLTDKDLFAEDWEIYENFICADIEFESEKTENYENNILDRLDAIEKYLNILSINMLSTNKKTKDNKNFDK